MTCVVVYIIDILLSLGQYALRGINCGLLT